MNDEWSVKASEQGIFWLLLDSEQRVITAMLPQELALEIANAHNRAPNPLMDEIERLTSALNWYATTTYPDDGSGRPPEAYQRKAKEALAGNRQSQGSSVPL